MKHIAHFIIFLFIAYHVSAQVDTAKKRLIINDTLFKVTRVSQNNMAFLSTQSMLSLYSDTTFAYKNSLLFLQHNYIKPNTPSSTFLNVAGSFLLSVLAEQTRHQYFYQPGK